MPSMRLSNLTAHPERINSDHATIIDHRGQRELDGFSGSWIVHVQGSMCARRPGAPFKTVFSFG
jgi:hypothetical protein